MSYPPGQKPPQWSIDPGIVAYNASRLGLPVPTGLWAMWEKGGTKVYDLSGNNRTGTLTNSPTWEPGGIEFNANLEHIHGPNGAFLKSEGTIVFGYKYTTATSYYYWFVLDDDYQEFALLGNESTGHIEFRINGILDAFTLAAKFWKDGKDHNLCVTWDDAANERILYDNGEFFELGSNAFTWDAAGVAAHDLRIGGRPGSNDRYCGGVMSYFYVFDKVLTPNQIAYLNINPYALIADPYQIETLGFVAAGGAYTLACASGSFTETGTAATLLKGSKIDIETGSFIETGTAANLLRGYVVSADGGSFALTGANAGLLKGSILGVESGTYVLTGQDATFGRTYIINPEAGVYVLTGFDAALNYSGAVSVRRRQGLLLHVY